MCSCPYSVSPPNQLRASSLLAFVGDYLGRLACTSRTSDQSAEALCVLFPESVPVFQIALVCTMHDRVCRGLISFKMCSALRLHETLVTGQDQKEKCTKMM